MTVPGEETDEESAAEVDSDEGEYDSMIRQLDESHPDLSKEALPLHHLHGMLRIQDCVTRPPVLPADLQAVASEVKRRGPTGSHQHRLQAMQSARALSATTVGQDQAVLSRIDPNIKKVLDAAGDSGAHPAFFQQMLMESGYNQVGVVRDLLEGFPLIGQIPVESSARRVDVAVATISVQELQSMAPNLTAKAIARQRAQASDPSNFEVQEEILRQTVEEIKLGRISEWEPVSTSPPAPPTRRFGVKQASSSGRVKTRCIDDLKESRINALCGIRGKIRMGRIADMVEVARQLQEAYPEERLVIFKADFKSAYRCVPIRPEHYPFAKILITDTTDGSLKQAQQYAMPFGSIAAVYGWDRLAHALTFLVSQILLLPVCRYVDDLFGVCFAHEVHFLRNSLIELIDMLGFKLASEKTPVPASIQVVLGIKLEIKCTVRRGRTTINIYASIEPAKAEHWSNIMEGILEVGYISARDAERLAGRLNFAAGAVAGRAGAARIRYVYCLAAKCGGRLVAQAREELQWWIQYLRVGQRHRFPLRNISLPVTVMYTDAEGRGGIGGCLCIESGGRKQRLFFADHLDQRFTTLLENRITQIIPLEAMAVAVGFEVFKMHLSGSKCIFLVDNQSVLGSLRKGRSKAADIHQIVCGIVDRIVRFSVMPFFLWVPSRYNLADKPSRGIMLQGFVKVEAKKGISAVMSDLKTGD